MMVMNSLLDIPDMTGQEVCEATEKDLALQTLLQVTMKDCQPRRVMFLSLSVCVLTSATC